MEKVVTELHHRASTGHTACENLVFLRQMPYGFFAFPGREWVDWDLTLTTVTFKILWRFSRWTVS